MTGRRMHSPLRSPRRAIALVALAAAGTLAFTAPSGAVTAPSQPDAVARLSIAHPGVPATSPTPATDARFAASPNWRAFAARAGANWHATFNPLNGAPHRAWGSGSAAGAGPVLSDADAESRARAFLTDNAALLACDPQDLVLARAVDRGGRYVVIFQQTAGGVPVEGGRVDVRLAADGRVSLFGSDFFPGVNISTTPRISVFSAAQRTRDEIGFRSDTGQERSTELRILPIQRGGRLEYRLAWRLEEYVPETPALWVSWVDAADGRTLWRYDDLRYANMHGTVDGDVQLVLPDDPYTDKLLDHLIVKVTGQGSDTTDASGAWSIAVFSPGTYTVTAQLLGAWLNVNNQAGPDASFSQTFSTANPVLIHWSDANSQPDERDSYFNCNIAHDTIRVWDPSLTEVNYQMPCAVSINSTCNAFWDGTGVNFFAAGGGCVNTGQMPDVAFHEYGHGITQFTYAPATCPGDMNEGFSDVYATYIQQQPVIGRGFFGHGTYLRTLDNNLIYPDSLNGEVHHDGDIIGGALWDMHVRLVSALGLNTGSHLADSLFHYARYAEAQSFNDYFLDLATEDDNDGDLGNGTPHGLDIYQAFAKHGIGPGLFLTVVHDTLKDTENPMVPVAVNANITSVLPLLADSLRVFYRTYPNNGSGWSAWTSTLLAPSGPPHQYAGTIPGEPESTMVQYYLYAKSETLGVVTQVPPTGVAAPYQFFVGPDREPPVIVANPLPNVTPDQWPSTVTATVTDNLAVSSVHVTYSKNGVAQPPFALSTAGHDVYTGAFPAGAVAGDVYDYQITATDASAAANTTVFPYNAPYRITVGSPLTLMNVDVETDPPGWFHYVGTPGYVDQWHISTDKNHTPGGSRSWKCGANTALGHYANHSDGCLQTAPVTLGDHSVLSFWHWIHAEEGDPSHAWDGGILEMTQDGGTTWQEVMPQVGGYDHTIIAGSDGPFAAGTPCWSGSFDWRQVKLDLAGITGTVSFRFRFGSDGATNDLGWYVDDIVITAVNSATGVALNPAGAPPVLLFALAQNEPNPFGAETAIRFSLAENGNARLAVYDVAGRRVRTLVEGAVAAGEHVARWDGRDESGTHVAPGIYFYRMDAGKFTATRKLIVR